MLKTNPIWNINSSETNFKSLNREISADVVVIGGGITGITTAQLLKERGFHVVLVEAMRVGQGTTGQSTGNLYALTEYSLQELKKKHNTEIVKKVIDARTETIRFIRDNVDKYKINCDLKSQSMYLFEFEYGVEIEKERDLATEIGLVTQPITDLDFPFPYREGMVLENQMQLNPLTYTQELAQRINGNNCQIYEETTVLEINEEADYISIKTDKATIKAKYVVHATHTPKGLLPLYHSSLGPYREYGIAVKLKNEAYPQGIFWAHYNNKKYSIRSYNNELNPYLICVGSMHKVGQAEDNRENVKELEKFVNTHFEVDTITHSWGGQNYKPADLLPYIGRKTKDSKQFVATGFSTDGLVYGTVAARIIVDEISEIENPYADLFKANRHQPIKAAGKFIKETVDVVGELVGDYFRKGEDPNVTNLLLGEGKLLQYDDGKYAVYKDEQGKISVLSPICPHMGCTVHFNHLEKSWDCPCHGSRFDTDGQLIEGSAFHGLKSI